MEQQQSSFKEKERTDLREPQHFKVIIYNDDFTTMEFVVKILTTIFFKSAAEAETLMLQVHKSQSAVVGIYRKPPAWHAKKIFHYGSPLHRKKNKN